MVLVPSNSASSSGPVCTSKSARPVGSDTSSRNVLDSCTMPPTSARTGPAALTRSSPGQPAAAPAPWQASVGLGEVGAHQPGYLGERVAAHDRVVVARQPVLAQLGHQRAPALGRLG